MKPMFNGDIEPMYIRSYRKGKTYTVVFGGRWPGKQRNECRSAWAEVNDQNQVGFFINEVSYGGELDKPRYSHLGKPVSWVDLPNVIKYNAFSTWADLWKLEKRFQLGQIVTTANAKKTIDSYRILLQVLTGRHQSGDWGDIEPDQGVNNDYAIDHDGEIMSAYQLTDHECVIVATTADRSTTTVMMSSEWDDYMTGKFR